MSNTYSVVEIDSRKADEQGKLTLSEIYRDFKIFIESTPSVNYTIALETLTKKTLFVSNNPVVLNVPNNATLEIPIGQIKEFSVTGNGAVTLSGSGITFVGTPLTFSKGSSFTLEKIDVDTWLVVGGRTKLSQFENDITTVQPYTVYIDTVNGNDSTGVVGLLGNPFKTDSVAFSALPANDGNPFTFVFLCSNVTRNIIFPTTRRIRFKTENTGIFNLNNWIGNNITVPEIYIDAPNSDILASISSQTLLNPTFPVYININNLTLVNTYAGGLSSWITSNEKSYIKANIVSSTIENGNGRLFNLGDIFFRKFISNRLPCLNTSNATIFELEILNVESFFGNTYPINKYKTTKISGGGGIIDISGILDVTGLEVSSNYVISSYGTLTGTLSPNFIGTLRVAPNTSNCIVRNFIGKFTQWNIDASTADNLTIEDSILYVDQYFVRVLNHNGTRNFYFKNVEIIATDNTTGLVLSNNTTAKIIINRTGYVKTNSFFHDQTTFVDRTSKDYSAYNKFEEEIENSASVNYTLSLNTLRQKTVFSATNPIILTVPTNTTLPIPIGSRKKFTVQGSGNVTIQGAGITFIGGNQVFYQGATFYLEKIATDTWSIDGNKTKLSQFEQDAIAQITITTATAIDVNTKDTNNVSQYGKNVIIDNGATAINYSVNGMITASYLKIGTANITFQQGSGRTLIVNGVATTTGVLSGVKGSSASITSVGTTDYLQLTNL